METPVILFHGMTQEQVIALMRACKQAAPSVGLQGSEIAFATSTANNLEWKLSEVVSEVAEEHAYMKANPPGGGKLA